VRISQPSRSIRDTGFFQGRQHADAPDAGERAEAVSDEAFRRTAIYQRAVNHPNLKRLLR
jgi:hypothetical protein